MVKIVIKSVADIEAFNRKLKTLISILPSMREFAINRAADEAVLTSIHRDMENNNFSKKIIDRTYVGSSEVTNNGQKITVHFISDYISDSGFDVSVGREEGTTDHDVFPKNPNGWLTYIDPNTGKRIFRKHTHPSGIDRLLIIESNINSNKESFKESYSKEISSQINQVFA